MKYYPVFINLYNKKCFIIGGGKVGERKALKLLDAGAELTIISPDLTPKLTFLKIKKVFTHINRKYKKGDIKDAFLVIAATSDRSLNRTISNHATCLINAVDMPELCNFIVPSTVKRGDLTIAISTSGVSPSLSKSLRKELEKIFTLDFVKFLAYLKDFRKKAFALSLNKKTRETLLKEAGSLRTIKLFREKGIKTVKEQFNTKLQTFEIK